MIHRVFMSVILIVAVFLSSQYDWARGDHCFRIKDEMFRNLYPLIQIEHFRSIYCSTLFRKSNLNIPINYSRFLTRQKTSLKETSEGVKLYCVDGFCEEY